MSGNPSNADTIGTTAACHKYRSAHILEASSIRESVDRLCSYIGMAQTHQILV